jgi:cell division protease FtsH
MDGFGTNSNVIVLAATNRADVLDKALMRAAVLTDKSLLTYQTFERLRYLKYILPLKKVDGLDTEFLAKQTQASLELILQTFVTKRH